MSKRAYYFGLAVIAGCLAAGAAMAKVWLLPDYQSRQVYSDRASERKTDSIDKNSITCASRGGVALSSLSEGQICNSPFTIPENLQKCCSSYSCSSAYTYDDSSCDVDKKLTPKGNSCTDSNGNKHYTDCGCSNSYQATEANCQYGADTTTDYCEFGGVKYYGACNDDPCLQTENVMTCAAERCQADKVCGDNLCLKDGCDTNCEAGFDETTGTCKKATCPTLYSTTVEGCEGAGLTLIDNSELALGENVSGSVGGVNCHECTVECKEGYADYDQYWCNVTPEADCEALGYTNATGISARCIVSKIRCPFDTSYYMCVGDLKKSGNISTNPVCSSTELLGDKSSHAYGASSSSTAKACHKAACKLTATNKIALMGVGTVYDLDDGGYVIDTCVDGYDAITDSNGCITGCFQQMELKDSCAQDSCPSGATCTKYSTGYYQTACPTGYETDKTVTGTYGTCVTCTCATGFAIDSESACACANGVTQTSVAGCYRCCYTGESCKKCTSDIVKVEA